MKRLYPYNRFVNESVRDKMTPKPEEDIWTSVRRRSPEKIINAGIESNSINMVKYGVEKWKNNPNRYMTNKNLLVTKSINYDQDEISDYLLDNNFHPGTESILGFIWNKKFDMVKHLIDKGVNMDGLKYSILKILTHGQGEWDDIGQTLIDRFPNIKIEVEKEVERMSKNLEKYQKFLR